MNIKQNIKQSWYIIKQNKIFSSIYILGTALSISMIMVIAMVWLFITDDIYPETNRSRTMIIQTITEMSEDGGSYSYAISHKGIETLIDGVDGVECIAEVITPWGKSYSKLPTEDRTYITSIKYTDHNFWKVFEFEFIEGIPYPKEEVRSKIKKAIISESFAKKIFKRSDIVGEKINIGNIDYIVSGVVKTSSYIATNSYADIWVPVTMSQDYSEAEGESGFLGGLTAYILLENSSKAESVYNKINDRVIMFNNSVKGKYEINIYGQPDTYYKSIFRQGNRTLDIKSYIIEMALILIALILIPALNLSGMISSRMYKRMEEIGIRKAFGASKTSIMSQILNENLLLTLLGGGLGLILSYLFMYIGSSWVYNMVLITSNYDLEGGNLIYSADMLLNPLIFIIALGICILLNILSAIIPARSAIRKNIIDSLNTKVK